MKKLSILTILFLSIINAQPGSDVPGNMSFQGFLTDSEGVSYADGQYNLTFRLIHQADQTPENTIWEEIQDVTTVYAEVEQITAVAGVRGAEAEDEALDHLYYRRSMKGLSKIDLQRALGKLIIKKEQLEKQKKETTKIDNYISQLKYRLTKV